MESGVLELTFVYITIIVYQSPLSLVTAILPVTLVYVAFAVDGDTISMGSVVDGLADEVEIRHLDDFELDK